MAYYSDSTVPSVAPLWGEQQAPLNQSREQTRDELRTVLRLPVTLDALVSLTRAMNTIAELSPEAVASVEALLAERKTLLADRVSAQSKAAWSGDAPLKKADVIEYDTSLLQGGNWAAMQTQGIDARIGAIETDISTTLGLNGPNAFGTARLYRS